MTEHKMDYSDLHDYERDHKVSFLPPIWKKQLKPAIHLRVFRNGDEKFSGKTITWDVHKQNNFVSFMNELSIRMKLTNGDAVWRLFTPRYGHRVSNFDRFQDGTMIVAAGNENFKPLRLYFSTTNIRFLNSFINSLSLNDNNFFIIIIQCTHTVTAQSIMCTENNYKI